MRLPPLTLAAGSAAAAPAPLLVPLLLLLLIGWHLDVEPILLQVALDVVDCEACGQQAVQQAGELLLR